MINRRSRTPKQALATTLARMLAVPSLLCAAPAIASAQNGTVNGTVTRAADGGGLTAGVVRFCSTASQCTNAALNASGAYSISLAPGTYFAFTEVSSAGLSNITTFNTGNAGTTFAVPGVPPGTYYVRLRALNGQGASPVSNEVVVVVSP